MRGPWMITLTKNDDDTYTATVDIQQLVDAATVTSASPEDAYRSVVNRWSAVLHEDFGPQDFVTDGTHLHTLLNNG